MFLIAVDQRVVREERLVVVEADEGVAFAVVEAPDDRADRRVDDPDAEKDERRREKGSGDAVPLPEALLLGSRAEAPREGPPPSGRRPSLVGVGLLRGRLHLPRDLVDVVRIRDEVREGLEQALTRSSAECRRLEVGEVEAEGLRLGERAGRRPRDLVGIDALRRGSCSETRTRRASPRSRLRPSSSGTRGTRPPPGCP